LFVRNQKVMLSPMLAELYGVEVRTLVQAVKRNSARFPDDFMFQLTRGETEFLKSQNVISKPPGRGGAHRSLPYAFTEQGVAMLSSVLKSDRAVRINIEIMRAFVKLRELLASNSALAQKLDELDRRISTHDTAIADLIEAIRQLMLPPDPGKKRPIGFAPWKDD